ncbi:thioredoxin family protein [Nocardia rhizosphaerae]|uniref:Thioredoxin family protein n=1 Tax=Nocardia rhizosphaerae TaxID=1691571 RepID=A0ABV8L8H3_9NOCA
MLEVLANAAAFRAAVRRRDIALAVLFHARWDVNSRMLRDEFGKFARTADERIACAAMEFDDWSRVVERYRVTAVPTILIFTGGRLSGRIVGARSAARVGRDIARYLPAVPDAAGRRSAWVGVTGDRAPRAPRSPL